MMQLHGEKVVAVVGIRDDVLAVTDEGRVFTRYWDADGAFKWIEQTPVPLRTSAQMGQPVQSVA